MPVDFGDVRTAASLTKATLSGQVTPGGPTLGDALMNANPLGNDVATA